MPPRQIPPKVTAPTPDATLTTTGALVRATVQHVNVLSLAGMLQAEMARLGITAESLVAAQYRALRESLVAATEQARTAAAVAPARPAKRTPRPKKPAAKKRASKTPAKRPAKKPAPRRVSPTRTTRLTRSR